MRGRWYYSCFARGYVMLSFSLSAVSCNLASGANLMTETLAVSVSVSKSQLTVGDSIKTSAVIKNISSESFYFEIRAYPHTIGHIKLFANGDTPLRHYIKIMFSLRPPSRSDFLELKPGDEVTMSFPATLREEAIRDIHTEGHPTVHGLFLDFGNSSILIPGKGKYGLRFQLEHDKEWGEEARKRFGLPNLWHGKLVSNPVYIVVR